MTVIERIAFTWVLSWVLMDSFLPHGKYADKMEATIIVTLSIAYLYGLHLIIFNKIRSIYRIALLKK